MRPYSDSTAGPGTLLQHCAEEAGGSGRLGRAIQKNVGRTIRPVDNILKKLKSKKNANKNKTKVVAEAGKQELFITREFEAPGSWYLRRFQIRNCWRTGWDARR